MAFNEDLGLRLGEHGELRLSPETRHEVAPGLVHFAVLTTMGEVAAARAAGAPVVPTHISVQLLRRAASEPELVARGRLLKSGRTLIFATGEVTQGDELVAAVTVTFARVG